MAVAVLGPAISSPTARGDVSDPLRGVQCRSVGTYLTEGRRSRA